MGGKQQKTQLALNWIGRTDRTHPVWIYWGSEFPKAADSYIWTCISLLCTTEATTRMVAYGSSIVSVWWWCERRPGRLLAIVILWQAVTTTTTHKDRGTKRRRGRHGLGPARSSFRGCLHLMFVTGAAFCPWVNISQRATLRLALIVLVWSPCSRAPGSRVIYRSTPAHRYYYDWTPIVCSSKFFGGSTGSTSDTKNALFAWPRPLDGRGIVLRHSATG